jgi:hypothetical protein
VGEDVARWAYEQFLEHDGGVEGLVAEWRSLAGTGRSYSPEEWKLIDRLITIDQRMTPVLLRLGSTVLRFGTYRSRLRAALAHLEEGGRDWFGSVDCDSYLTVWRQLGAQLAARL